MQIAAGVASHKSAAAAGRRLLQCCVLVLVLGYNAVADCAAFAPKHWTAHCTDSRGWITWIGGDPVKTAGGHGDAGVGVGWAEPLH